jgi:hypothetical protein
VLNLLLGHLLRAVLGSGIAVAAAAIANGASSAAIATLGFTVGTGALEFVAAGRGGILQKLAAGTPTALLRVFEQGQFAWSTVVVTLALGTGGFALAAAWLRQGEDLRRRLLRTAATALVFVPIAWGASLLRTTWDLSENRRNSFSQADETALRQIRRPLQVTVFLAPEDPRLLDLERNILSKLGRILPRVEIVYAARSRTGLFDRPGDHYGELWYELGGGKAISRSTTEPIVLDTLYRLAEVQPPVRREVAFPGHPLAAGPKGAAWCFYAFWPLIVMVAGWAHFRIGS